MRQRLAGPNPPARGVALVPDVDLSSLREAAARLNCQYRERQEYMEVVSPLIYSTIDELQQSLRTESKKKTQHEREHVHLVDLADFRDEQAKLIMQSCKQHRGPSGKDAETLPQIPPLSEGQDLVRQQVLEMACYCRVFKSSVDANSVHLRHLTSTQKKMLETFEDITAILSARDAEVSEAEKHLDQSRAKFEEARSLLCRSLAAGGKVVPSDLRELLSNDGREYIGDKDVLVMNFLQEFLPKKSSLTSPSPSGRPSLQSPDCGRPSLDEMSTRPSLEVGGSRPSLTSSVGRPSLGSVPDSGRLSLGTDSNGRPSLDVGAVSPLSSPGRQRADLRLRESRREEARLHRMLDASEQKRARLVSLRDRLGSEDRELRAKLKAQQGSIVEVHREHATEVEALKLREADSLARCRSSRATLKELQLRMQRVRQSRHVSSSQAHAEDGEDGQLTLPASAEDLSRENRKLVLQKKEAAKSIKRVEDLHERLEERNAEMHALISQARRGVAAAEAQANGSRSASNPRFAPPQRGAQQPGSGELSPLELERLRHHRRLLIAAGEEEVQELRKELQALQNDAALGASSSVPSSPGDQSTLKAQCSYQEAELRAQLLESEQVENEATRLRLERDRCREALSKAWESLASPASAISDVPSQSQLLAENTRLGREIRRVEREMEQQMLVDLEKKRRLRLDA